MTEQDVQAFVIRFAAAWAARDDVVIIEWQATRFAGGLRFEWCDVDRIRLQAGRIIEECASFDAASRRAARTATKLDALVDFQTRSGDRRGNGRPDRGRRAGRRGRRERISFAGRRGSSRASARPIRARVCDRTAREEASAHQWSLRADSPNRSGGLQCVNQARERGRCAFDRCSLAEPSDSGACIRAMAVDIGSGVERVSGVCAAPPGPPGTAHRLDKPRHGRCGCLGPERFAGRVTFPAPRAWSWKARRMPRIEAFRQAGV